MASQASADQATRTCAPLYSSQTVNIAAAPVYQWVALPERPANMLVQHVIDGTHGTPDESGGS